TTLHTIGTIFSMTCLLTAVVSLLPPESIGNRAFITVFYSTIGVISVVVIAALWSNCPRFAAFVFPALAVAAVLVPLLAGGIIFGLFAWLALATHVMLVVPALRQRAMAVK